MLGLAIVAFVVAAIATLFTLWVRGYTLWGKWDKVTIPHECHTPNEYSWPTADMPKGAIWRCRKCKKGWEYDGYRFRSLKDSLERELNM